MSCKVNAFSGESQPEPLGVLLMEEKQVHQEQKDAKLRLMALFRFHQEHLAKIFSKKNLQKNK